MRLWDVASGRALRLFRGHRKPVWAVAYTPDGKEALSAGYDEVVKVWDLATGNLVAP
jgi:WD40 repeat protein